MKIWLFRIFAVFVVPSLFLLTIEGGLRFFNYGYATDFVKKCDQGDKRFVCANDRFTWQFFSPRMARSPIPFKLSAKKPAQTFRIFILGGSAAQGDPDPTFGFGRILGVMLRERYPGVTFEVINSAITAVNSHVMLPVAKAAAELEPDLFIVFLGNNEVVGPFGAGTVFSPATTARSLIKAGILLKSTRIGQLMQQIMANSMPGPKSGEWQGMQMFIEQQVRFSDPRMDKVYDNFALNLRDIMETAHSAGAATILSTVAVNLKDCPPFGSLHNPDITEESQARWNNLYRSGNQELAEKNYAKALDKYLQASRIDDQYAELQYLIGLVYLNLGQPDQARDYLAMARDLDTLRFRADSTINQTIRKVFEKTHSGRDELFDAVEVFASNSKGGITGKDFFYEHVHLNFAGNYLLASRLLPSVDQVLPQWAKTDDTRLPLSAEECARRLALTDYDKLRITENILQRFMQPPFIEQYNHQEQILDSEKKIVDLQKSVDERGFESLALFYDEALHSSKTDPWLHFNYAKMLQEYGKYAAAEAQYQLFLIELPDYLPARDRLSAVLAEQGRFDEVLEQATIVVDSSPQFYNAYYDMAFALSKLGRVEESFDIYKTLLNRDPENSTQIMTEMARIKIFQQQLDAARELFQEAIRFNKEHGGDALPDLHYNLGYVFKRLGLEPEARKELLQAAAAYRLLLARDDFSAETCFALGSTMVELGDFSAAAVNFLQAVNLEPQNISYRQHTAKALVLSGRKDEALNVLRDGYQLMLQAGRARDAQVLIEDIRKLQAGR